MYTMSTKLLIYENTAIGIIAQRIGECRLANRYFINPKQFITQQISTIEKYYRDSIITVGDKFIVIEFKAPQVKNNNTLVYSNINLKSLKEIANKIGAKNVFLALIHAYLLCWDINLPKNSTGFYLWYAVPGTTAFIPLSKLPMSNLPNATVNLEVRRADCCINKEYVLRTQIPTCVRHPTPIISKVSREPSCSTCGGLFYNHLIVYLLNNEFCITSYTFAKLMEEFAAQCNIGFKVESPDKKDEFYRIINILSDMPKQNIALLVSGREGPFLANLKCNTVVNNKDNIKDVYE
ncbi:MAG: hypothetical protein LRS48_06550 [Desulfurococcales archaeon]|nr:hypothetical protein [Desulfurococcales archaeon]